MIDIESKVITTLQSAFTSASKTVTVISSYSPVEPAFPCVIVQQTSNSTYEGSLDNSSTEHHARVVFQVDVYSDKASGGKKEVKELFNIVDATMQGMRFVRNNYQDMPPTEYSLTRCVGVYTAIVESPKTVGENTVYQIYR